MLSIGGLTTRIALVLGEGNGEHSEHVAISGLDIREGLDERLEEERTRKELVDVVLVRVWLAGVKLGTIKLLASF